jgi:hypothetical protein
MKTVFVKTIVLSLMSCGAGMGLVLYNQVLEFFSKLVSVAGHSWISISAIFVVGILLSGAIIRYIVVEFKTINSLNELNLLKMLKIFIGGFFGVYAGFSVVGALAFLIIMLMKTI